MVKMKPIDLKKVAKRFTEKYYPQWLSRFDRIWEMFEKTDLNKIVSDPAKSQYQQGNAFGIAGTAEPESKEYMSGIAIVAFTYHGAKDKDSISNDEIIKRISLVPNLKITPGVQQKLENVISEMLPLMAKNIEEQPESKTDNLELLQVNEKMTEYNQKLSSIGVSEYRVWYNDSEPSGLPIDIITKEKIVTRKREKYNLFIVREEALTQIFINGGSATSKPSKSGYRILTFALKFRGNCGTAWNIAKHIYDIEEAEKFKDLREMAKVVKEQPKLNSALQDFKEEPGSIENYSNRVRKLTNSLNQGFLIYLDTSLMANNMGEYQINPMIKYCLIEKS